MSLFSFFGQELLGDRQSAVRIEKLQRNFTWAVLFFIFLAFQLPFIWSFSLRMFYPLFFLVAAFALVWYHLLPKRFSGPLKNLVYIIISIFFIGFLVHLTGGVKSFAHFFYALTALSVAISMGVVVLVFSLSLIALSLFLATLGTFQEGNFFTNFSVSLFWFWGIVMVALYGRMLASQLVAAKKEEKSAEIEKTQSINRLQDEFVFFVSHRLKIPILVLCDYLAQMSAAVTTEKIKEISRQLWQASLKLSRLVDLFLDIAKIEAGRLTVNIQTVDLPQSIKTVMTNFQILAQGRQIALLYQGPQRLAVKADPDRLGEIVTNLLDNAIKYSPQSAKVTVSVQQKGKSAITSVIDQAGGIDSVAQKHIFQKYYRAKKGGKVAGTGLGLYISKLLIEKQNGRIWFETHPPKGSIFSFSLPLA